MKRLFHQRFVLQCLRHGHPCHTEKKQVQAAAAVNRALGQQLQVQYQFTLGVNGVATTVRYDQIAKIETLEYVREVYVENRYELDEESPDTATSGTMVALPAPGGWLALAQA